MPNLHKFKMAAISIQFACIMGPENAKNWILVSLPMFSGSRNAMKKYKFENLKIFMNV